MSPQTLNDLVLMPEILHDIPKPLPFPVIWYEFTTVTYQNGEVCSTTEIIQGQAEVYKLAGVPKTAHDCLPKVPNLISPAEKAQFQ